MKAETLLLDSSVWVELFSQVRLWRKCEREQKKADFIVIPTLVLYEVYRKIVSATSEDRGLSAVVVMSCHEVADLTREVALTAADLSLEHKLPMADSIVLAHARQASAELVTLKNDFAGIPGAKVLR